MRYYEIKLGLEQDQTRMVDTVKSNGGEVI